MDPPKKRGRPATKSVFSVCPVFKIKAFPFKSQNFSRKDASNKSTRSLKNSKQILSGENYHLFPIDSPTYRSIVAPPSVIPVKKYCDLTGLEAPYRDPKTNVFFSSAKIFPEISELNTERVQQLLQLRGANSSIK